MLKKPGAKFLPPLKSSKLLDKLAYCDSDECIEKLVEEYLNSLMRSKTQNNINTTFKLLKDEDTEETDEKVISNSLKFSEELIKKTIFSDSDIDLMAIITDLEEKLGKTHPVVIFLKQLVEE